MKVTLIITTYKRPNALKLVLNSILQQSILPGEIIIGDDGSGTDTTNLIKEYQTKFSIPVKHIWQEDKGFRVAKIRNKAILASNYEYIISIDGDIVLHQKFIESHLHFIKKGVFLQGHRVMLNPELTKRAIKLNLLKFSFFNLNLSNRKNTIHNFFLANIFSLISKKHKGLKGGVLSFWKEDALSVNGFDEDFIGWGKEDTEYAIRLLNLGIKRKDLRFCAVGFHLDHGNSNKDLESDNYKRNINKLNKTINQNLIRCKNGIIKN